MSLRNPRPCGPLTMADLFAAQKRIDAARTAMLQETKGTMYHASASSRWREAIAVRDYIEGVLSDAGEYEDRKRRGTLFPDSTNGKAHTHAPA